MDNKIESIKKEFQKKDYELISTTYTNKNIKLDYICNKHKDVGMQILLERYAYSEISGTSILI